MMQENTSIRRCIQITVTTIRFGSGTIGEPAPVSIGITAGAFVLKMIARIPSWRQASSGSTAGVIILTNQI